MVQVGDGADLEKLAEDLPICHLPAAVYQSIFLAPGRTPAPLTPTQKCSSKMTDSAKVFRATTTAPVNIAVIKYVRHCEPRWGATASRD